MKFSAATLASFEKAQQKSDEPTQRQYLNPNEIEMNKEVEFCFLSDEPFEFWEVWGEPVDPDGRMRPFRFPYDPEDVNETPPSEDEIRTEMGQNYMHQILKWDQGKYKKGDKTPPNKCMAWPVYNLDEECVQTFKVAQASIKSQITSKLTMKKYRKRSLDFNYTLHKSKQKNITTYTFDALDRDDDFNEEPIDKAWEQAQAQGYDIKVLLTNGNPMNPEGD